MKKAKAVLMADNVSFYNGDIVVSHSGISASPGKCLNCNEMLL